VSDAQAELLSPIDAATLWPQLHRLGTEVAAVRLGESLLVRAGVAATGLTRLPRMPRTILLGIRKRLGYRGVLVARELAGGQSWEVVSLRLHREKDDGSVQTLLDEAAREIARRGGRGAFLRMLEGSPHQAGATQAGFAAYTSERLYAPPPGGSSPGGAGPFREARASDGAGIFRLYCRAVPESVRRQEALTQQEWRAVHDLYGAEREFVRDEGGSLVVWCGLTSHEAHVLLSEGEGDLAGEALACIGAHLGESGTLVAAGYQPALERAALERRYLPLGRRLVLGRRLALLRRAEERVALADTFAVPQ